MAFDPEWLRQNPGWADFAARYEANQEAQLANVDRLRAQGLSWPQICAATGMITQDEADAREKKLKDQIAEGIAQNQNQRDEIERQRVSVDWDHLDPATQQRLRREADRRHLAGLQRGGRRSRRGPNLVQRARAQNRVGVVRVGILPWPVLKD
jgi:hypothetical protein